LPHCSHPLAPRLPQDVLYAYLTCNNYDFRYDIQKGCVFA